MEALKYINISIRFILELILLWIFGFSSYHIFQNGFIKWIMVIGLPTVVAVIWAIFIAPKSENLLPLPYRLIVEIILFSSASYLLYFAGYQKYAILFISIAVLNGFLMYIWKQ